MSARNTLDAKRRRASERFDRKMWFGEQYREVQRAITFVFGACRLAGHAVRLRPNRQTRRDNVTHPRNR